MDSRLFINDTLNTIEVKKDDPDAVIWIRWGHKQIETSELAMLANALSGNEATLNIVLTDNKLKDDGIILLAKTLKTNPSINTLMLAGNDITDEGLLAIADAIKDKTGPMEINLIGNPITKEGFAEFEKRIKNNPLIKYHVSSALKETKTITEKSHFDIGKDAVKQVNERIVMSSSFGFVIQGMRERELTPLESLKEIYSIPDQWEFLRIKRQEKNFKINKMGKCGEYSSWILQKLRKENLNAELVVLKNGNHAFVVIDRDLKGDINDPKTWGPDAIVCDGLTGECYFAKDQELKKIMQRWVISNQVHPPEPKFFSSFTLTNKKDPLYQENLGQEALARLEMINGVLKPYLLNPPIQELDQARAYIAAMKDKSLTNNDVERGLYKCIRHALRHVEEVPIAERSKVVHELVAKFTEYVENHFTPKKREEFLTIINHCEHGMYPEAIKSQINQKFNPSQPKKKLKTY